MKNFFKILGIIALVAVIGFSFSACNDIVSVTEKGDNTTSDHDTIVAPVNKYEAKSYSSNNINDRIKYSYTYDGYDFYYIYLGELKNIPIFYRNARYYPGNTQWTYTFSTTDIKEEYVKNTVEDSRQEAIGIVNEHTYSKTSGEKVTSEIGAKLTIKGIFEIPTKVAKEISSSAENIWLEYISNYVTTSITKTQEHASNHTLLTMESDEWVFTPADKVGYYRWTLFSTSDVYLYVIRDSNADGIYYEFREHVIPDVYFWRMDYSETSSFRKSDATTFVLDVSILDNLPKPKSVMMPPSFEITFNSNGGSSVPKQAVPSNGTVTKPADPTKNGYTFTGWYTGSELQNLYDFSTKVVDDITLHAKWDAVPTHTVTYSVNGGSGTAPASQTAIAGSSITLPSGNGITRSGYIFVGWNTNTSGTGTTYNNGYSYTVNSNVTLYAKWSATSFNTRLDGSNNFGIKGGATRDWLITSPFDIAGLRNAGYTKFVFTLKFDTKNELLINIGSRLYASFWKGLAPSITMRYNEKYWTPALNRWEAKEFIHEINLTDFENQLTIRFSTSSNASYTVGTRSVTIEAKK